MAIKKLLMETLNKRTVLIGVLYLLFIISIINVAIAYGGGSGFMFVISDDEHNNNEYRVESFNIPTYDGYKEIYVNCEEQKIIINGKEKRLRYKCGFDYLNATGIGDFEFYLSDTHYGVVGEPKGLKFDFSYNGIETKNFTFNWFRLIKYQEQEIISNQTNESQDVYTIEDMIEDEREFVFNFSNDNITNTSYQTSINITNDTEISENQETFYPKQENIFQKVKNFLYWLFVGWWSN